MPGRNGEKGHSGGYVGGLGRALRRKLSSVAVENRFRGLGLGGSGLEDGLGV